jgi:hypothetical protein
MKLLACVEGTVYKSFICQHFGYRFGEAKLFEVERQVKNAVSILLRGFNAILIKSCLFSTDFVLTYDVFSSTLTAKPLERNVY